jgi:hypothetical protein
MHGNMNVKIRIIYYMFVLQVSCTMLTLKFCHFVTDYSVGALLTEEK